MPGNPTSHSFIHTGPAQLLMNIHNSALRDHVTRSCRFLHRRPRWFMSSTGHYNNVLFCNNCIYRLTLVHTFDSQVPKTPQPHIRDVGIYTVVPSWNTLVFFSITCNIGLSRKCITMQYPSKTAPYNAVIIHIMHCLTLSLTLLCHGQAWKRTSTHAPPRVSSRRA
jgi:hypothetical protein